jgi:hypothetical protein
MREYESVNVYGLLVKQGRYSVLLNGTVNANPGRLGLSVFVKRMQ